MRNIRIFVGATQPLVYGLPSTQLDPYDSTGAVFGTQDGPDFQEFEIGNEEYTFFVQKGGAPAETDPIIATHPAAAPTAPPPETDIPPKRMVTPEMSVETHDPMTIQKVKERQNASPPTFCQSHACVVHPRQ